MALPRVTIVIDTSVLIDSLDFIQELFQHASSHYTELLLPRETIKELDKIKDRQPINSQLGCQVRKAIKWINTVFVAQVNDEFPTLRGQKAHETLNPQLEHDDAIIDCAVYNAKATGRLTIVTSNDNNLNNRAVIEGLETLETTSPDVTPQRVFDAIDQRTINMMELDDSQTSHWSTSPPPLSSESTPELPTPVPPQGDAEMLDELPQPSLPPPVEGTDMQSQITQNIANLIDWHLHRLFTDDELAYFKYKKPQPASSSKIAQVLKKYMLNLSDVVPSSLAKTFIDTVTKREVNKQYIIVHVELLRALAGNNPEYSAMIQKYFKH